MLFNSLTFLIFFPVVCLLYWLLTPRLRNGMLLIASYYFYMNWEPVYALLILFSTVSTWGSGLLISRENQRQRQRLWLSVCIIVNLGILFIFKYFNFITESTFSLLESLGLRMDVPHFTLLLPVGISFYTFQAIGYIIDVYRGKTPVEKSLFKYALFVAFFPQLVAGPIERSYNLLQQFRGTHRFNGQEIVEGLKIMAFGYFMKLCIADNVSPYVDAVFNNLPHHNGTSVLLAAFFFTFQIFCDFSGYSMIAIGAARCMGFSLMQNFKQPYLSTSPKDFWHRWHISLSSWFAEYVYIPMGGNRCSKTRHMANTMATMTLSGLWHGANWTFVVWGIYHGILVTVTNSLRNVVPPKIFAKFNILRKTINILVTFMLITIGWVFFRANSLSDAFLALKKMATEHGMLYNGAGLPAILLPLMLIGFLMLRELYVEYKWNIPLFNRTSLARDIVFTGLLVIVILLCGSFDGGQFIYFQF